MVLAVISETTIIEFMEDKEAFELHSKECFKILDSNGDGVISRAEFDEGFHKIMALEFEFRPKHDIENLCQQVFDRFDEDKTESLSDQQFRCLMTEIMLAMARGIGDSPVLVALHSRSFMIKVIQHQSSVL